MSTPDLSNAHWFKSSRSANEGDCVECAYLPGTVAIRDSKDRGGPALLVSPAQWSTFVRATATGTLTTEYAAQNFLTSAVLNPC